MRYRNIWTIVLALIGVRCVAALPEPQGADSDSNWNANDIITRDICIIGGGSSGTYSAIRLQDMNQSVVIVERTNRLGGHTETFTDPVTQAKVDIGVVVWHDLDIVKNYFARFDVPLTTTHLESNGVVTEFVDFRTGAADPGFVPSDPTAALGAYAAQLIKYPFLEVGFDLPDPVPEDLLLPFGDFVTKYNLAAAVNTIFSITEGIGNLLSTPTLYVMKLFGLGIIQNLQSGFLTTARHDNSEIYEKAQAQLLSANALLLSSQVASVKHNQNHVRVEVTTPSGRKLIKAKKLLITIPPTLENLANFNLDSTEQSLFSQFKTTGYYTGLVRNSGIPDNIALQNVDPNTLYNLPPLPGFYGTQPTGVPGLHQVLYGSPTAVPNEQVMADIVASIQRLGSAGTLPTTTPDFAVFSGHIPFEFTVSTDAIKNGFYRQLIALQGHRQTFYNGAAFDTHDSSLLWQFTETLLPSIVA